jgi:hypothetical protein
MKSNNSGNDEILSSLNEILIYETYLTKLYDRVEKARNE